MGHRIAGGNFHAPSDSSRCSFDALRWCEGADTDGMRKIRWILILFSGGLVPADKGGWEKDGIDGGRIILNFINGEVDLLLKDATGTTRSVKQDSGKIHVRKTTHGLIALTVFYQEGAQATEDYVFQLDDRGNGTVVFTTVRTAAPVINKVSLMRAQCRGPR
jgi:hypothetical protein